MQDTMLTLMTTCDHCSYWELYCFQRAAQQQISRGYLGNQCRLMMDHEGEQEAKFGVRGTQRYACD